MYLLDTCVVSELRKSSCDAGVTKWINSIHSSTAFLSALSVGEIRRGIELHRPKDPVAANSLERWLVGLELHYGDRILPLTTAICDRWGRLGLKQPLPMADGLIAATAIEHRLTVVTRNEADFLRSGAPVFNPFASRRHKSR